MKRELDGFWQPVLGFLLSVGLFFGLAYGVDYSAPACPVAAPHWTANR